MNVKKLRLHLMAWAIAGSTTLIAMAGEPTYTIVRSSIDGGGTMSSTGGDYELSGAIGQPDAGTMSGGGFSLGGGFWFPLSPTDCNEDGGVTLLDYQEFESCLTGPDGIVAAGCECYDVDHSGAIDLADFAKAQAAFSGG